MFAARHQNAALVILKQVLPLNIKWAVAGTHALAYRFIINRLGATDSHQLGVAALANGATIACELRLDLVRIRSTEYDIVCRRVNT